MIDILMATYNGMPYLREQIESIIGQTYADWNLLISDDCSSDETVAVIEEYVQRDSRIKLVSSESRYGCAKSNFINLVKYSSAEYAMFCDQDDVWLPNKIELTIGCMHELEKSHERAAALLVFTDMFVVDENLSVIADSFEALSNIDPERVLFRQLLAQSVGAGCTMMINRVLIGLLNESSDVENMIMHDWWASLIAACFGSIGHVAVSTSLYRQHSDNSVGAVEYAPIRKLVDHTSMVDSVLGTFLQAESFRKQFGPRMTKENYHILSEYANIVNEKPFNRILKLIKSGCWKKGMRKIGQVLACLEMGSPAERVNQ